MQTPHPETHQAVLIQAAHPTAGLEAAQLHQPPLLD